MEIILTWVQFQWGPNVRVWWAVEPSPRSPPPDLTNSCNLRSCWSSGCKSLRWGTLRSTPLAALTTWARCISQPAQRKCGNHDNVNKRMWYTYGIMTNFGIHWVCKTTNLCIILTAFLPHWVMLDSLEATWSRNIIRRWWRDGSDTKSWVLWNSVI